jgi:hypothetical protein
MTRPGRCKGLGSALPPPKAAGFASTSGGWICRIFDHDWSGQTVRGDDGEPCGQVCLRCRAKRSVTGGPCRCLCPCRCAEIDAMIIDRGWSEWMGKTEITFVGGTE